MKLLKGILGLPNKALRGAAEHLAIRWLRKAAESDGYFGNTLRAIKGKKTWGGLLIGAVGFTVAAYGDPGLAGVSEWLGVAGAVLAGAGLVDKAVHNPGRPAVLAESGWYRALADNSGLIATGLTSAFGYVYGAGCEPFVAWSLVVSCAVMGKTLLGTSALLVYIGVLDQAFLSAQPRKLVR